MKGWLALLKKELRLTRSVVWTGIVLMIVIYLFNHVFVSQTGLDQTRLGPAAGLLFLHIFYLPVYMLISLQAETRHMHLWLHHPGSGWMLMGTKLLSGILAFVLSLAVTLVLTGITLYPDIAQNRSELLSFFPLIVTSILHLAGYGVYLAVWFVFLWTVYQILKSRIGKWSWLAIAALLLISFRLLHLIREAAWYRQVTQWGMIQLDLAKWLDAFFPGQVPGTNPVINLYAGEYAFYVLLSVVLFWVSGWMLDRKVEV
ncbi:MAG: hypothetical protein H0Z33_11810 [Bacillaceae bacterium]|nr:hypothetical protein [Bacillaceae bacterium]